MRRLVLVLAAVLAAAAPARAADGADVFRALDAVGTLGGHDYDPRPVIAAVNALQPLGKERGVALLKRYLAARPGADGRDALFVVLRTVLDPPPDATRPPGACTPAQKEVAAGGCWRPPRLGAPVPAAPEELRSLRFPAFVLGDVPLSLVSGYQLGGEAEPLADHLAALAPLGTWRAAPLAPKTAGEIRYLFMHYGQWSTGSEVGRMVEAQLRRLEATERGPCLDLGLVCVPRSARTEAALRAAVGIQGLARFTLLEPGDKRLLFAVLTWPTDSESYVTVLAWSYTRHFEEWRLVLHQEVYGAVEVTPVHDAARAAVVLRARSPEAPEALVLPLAHVPYSARD